MVCPLTKSPETPSQRARRIIHRILSLHQCRDYEYERYGTANLFVLVEPLAGWRHVQVTARRTKQDYAEILRYLAEERYPDAECICVVQDNLNTHTAGALYATFPPQQARHIL